MMRSADVGQEARLTVATQPGSSWRMTAGRGCACRPSAKCQPGADDGYGLAAYRRWCPNRRPKERAPTKEQFMSRMCPVCSTRLDQQATTCPKCGADLAADDAEQAARAASVDETVRNTAVAAHLSTFAGLLVPFGSVIGPLTVWLTRRDRDPFIDQAGREALNFGITITIYGAVALVAALMLVGIPLLVLGVIAWVVVASLAATKASQGQAYRYPLTLRLVR
jgi:uncharacterized Tic20 family protein